jgi:hypothetical protein
VVQDSGNKDADYLSLYSGRVYLSASDYDLAEGLQARRKGFYQTNERSVQQYLVEKWLVDYLRELQSYSNAEVPPEWEAKDYIVKKIEALAMFIDEEDWLKATLNNFEFKEYASE